VDCDALEEQMLRLISIPNDVSSIRVFAIDEGLPKHFILNDHKHLRDPKVGVSKAMIGVLRQRDG
jgi:hypothetical protein